MSNKLKNKEKKKGFTLIELIIVMAIIAILAGLAIPKFGQVRNDANKKSDVANAKTIASGVTVLMANGDIESNDREIAVIKDATSGDEKAIKDYLQSVPIPKSVNENNFVVKVRGNGEITVKAGSDTFFPEYVDGQSGENNEGEGQ